MADLDTLREQYKQAEERAYKLQADRHDALQKVADQFGDQLREANDAAAAAQKAYCDAEAAHALVGRDDAERVASNLGLKLPE